MYISKPVLVCLVLILGWLAYPSKKVHAAAAAVAAEPTACAAVKTPRTPASVPAAVVAPSLPSDASAGPTQAELSRFLQEAPTLLDLCQRDESTNAVVACVQLAEKAFLMSDDVYQKLVEERLWARCIRTDDREAGLRLCRAGWEIAQFEAESPTDPQTLRYGTKACERGDSGMCEAMQFALLTKKNSTYELWQVSRALCLNEMNSYVAPPDYCEELLEERDDLYDPKFIAQMRQLLSVGSGLTPAAETMN